MQGLLVWRWRGRDVCVPFGGAINWPGSRIVASEIQSAVKGSHLSYVYEPLSLTCTSTSFPPEFSMSLQIISSAERIEPQVPNPSLEVSDQPSEAASPPNSPPRQISPREMMRRGKGVMPVPASHAPPVNDRPSSSRPRAATPCNNPFQDALAGKRAHADAVSFHRVISRKYTNGMLIANGDIHQSADFGVDMLEEGDKAELAKMCRRKVCRVLHF